MTTSLVIKDLNYYFSVISDYSNILKTKYDFASPRFINASLIICAIYNLFVEKTR